MDENSSQPTEEQQNAVSFVQKGSTLTKIGTNGHRYQRHFYVDTKAMALLYSGSKKHCRTGEDKPVPIRSIDRIRDQDDPDPSSSGTGGQKTEALFVLVLDKGHKLKTLIAPEPEVRDTWVCGLRYLIGVRSVGDAIQEERMWLKERFAQADKNGDKVLDKQETIKLLNSLNVGKMDSKYVVERVQSLGKISVDQFITLYKEFGQRKELRELFERYSENHQFLTAAELSKFFEAEENEVLPSEKVEHIIGSCEPCPDLRNEIQMSFTGFGVMFTSPRLNVKRPECLAVYQDMTQPLTHYFINSSHNTYLAGHQTVGASTAEQYRTVISQGCRCIELDVWDGDDGEPAIYHGIAGYTLTSKVPLREVLNVINEYAFEMCEYPLILSLENHASADQQARMAQLLKEIFGERLYTDPLWEGSAVFPSPEKLKGRVVIQGAKPASSSQDDGSDDDEPSPGEIPEGNSQLRDLKKLRPAAEVQLSDCVSIYQAEKFRSLAESENRMSFLNISETKVGQMLTAQGDTFVGFNIPNLTRIYPAWYRTGSGNYDPVPMWNSGCQIVSLNFQTHDDSTRLNRGLFEDNGSCGFVLKPNFMRSSGVSFTRDLRPESDWARLLKIRVISGYMLPKKPRDDNSDILDPYVTITIHGIADDKKVGRTKTISNNGFNPQWNEAKEFAVSCPQMALVQFQVIDNVSWGRDILVAEYCVPMRCLQTGYRMVALRDTEGKRIGPTGLFVHISIHNP